MEGWCLLSAVNACRRKNQNRLAMVYGGQRRQRHPVNSVGAVRNRGRRREISVGGIRRPNAEEDRGGLDQRQRFLGAGLVRGSGNADRRGTRLLQQIAHYGRLSG